MLEVEVKAHVGDFEEIKVKLSQVGAQKQGVEHQKDTYFNAPHRDYAVTDEALRIREVSQEDGTVEFILTYKGAKLDQASKTRREIEVYVDNEKKAAALLEGIGFRPVKTIRKDRTIYHYRDYTIALDEVYGVGKFVEIERGVQEGEDYQDALEDIFRIYREIGVEDGFERQSYMELLEQKK